jgi:hypothetical protein
MAVDRDGKIYITHPTQNSITIVSPSGVCTSMSTGNKTPTCITVDSDNNVYYTDTTNAMITKFNQYGTQEIQAVNNNLISSTFYPNDMPVAPILAATPTRIFTTYIPPDAVNTIFAANYKYFLGDMLRS